MEAPCKNNEVFRSVSRKATQSIGPNMLVKKDARNDHDGRHKQAVFDPEAGAHLHRKAERVAQGQEEGQLARRMQLDATRWAALGPQIKQRTGAAGTLEGQRRWLIGINGLLGQDDQKKKSRTCQWLVLCGRHS